jgi:RNA polymerase primary sigma factor
MSTVSNSFNQTIKNNPLLSYEEEVRLSRLAKKGDLNARKKLIESNYRLVISIAKKYHRKNHDFEDLVQESTAGLLKAVDKFDPELGYKFSTYASSWIKQAALSFLNENQTNIKVPTHSRILFSKINFFVIKFKKENGRNPTYKDISKELEIPIKKIKYTLKCNKSLISLESENKSGKTVNEYISEKIVDNSTFINPEDFARNNELISIIKNSLKLLTPKEEKVIRLRFGIQESNPEEFPVTEDMKKYLLDKE